MQFLLFIIFIRSKLHFPIDLLLLNQIIVKLPSEIVILQLLFYFKCLWTLDLLLHFLFLLILLSSQILLDLVSELLILLFYFLEILDLFDAFLDFVNLLDIDLILPILNHLLCSSIIILSTLHLLITLTEITQSILAMEVLILQILKLYFILLKLIQSFLLEYFQSIKHLVHFFEFDAHPVKREVPLVEIEFSHMDVPIGQSIIAPHFDLFILASCDYALRIEDMIDHCDLLLMSCPSIHHH